MEIKKQRKAIHLSSVVPNVLDFPFKYSTNKIHETNHQFTKIKNQKPILDYPKVTEIPPLSHIPKSTLESKRGINSNRMPWCYSELPNQPRITSQSKLELSNNKHKNLGRNNTLEFDSNRTIALHGNASTDNCYDHNMSQGIYDSHTNSTHMPLYIRGTAPHSMENTKLFSVALPSRSGHVCLLSNIIDKTQLNKVNKRTIENHNNTEIYQYESNHRIFANTEPIRTSSGKCDNKRLIELIIKTKEKIRDYKENEKFLIRENLKLRKEINLLKTQFNLL